MKYEKFFTWRSAVLNSSLPPTTRHVLLTLACHMNDAGESCYPSITRLCLETGLSKQTVITHLGIAQTAGLLKISKHGFSGQGWSRNDYQISWPEGGQAVRPPSSEKAVKEVDHLPEKAVNLINEGGQPNSEKAVKEVDPSTPVNSSQSTPVYSQGRKRDVKPAPKVEPSPPGLDVTAWQRWLTYRQEIRRPLKPASIPAAQRKLAAFGKDQAAVVEQSIADGYQGLFALKNNGSNRAARPVYGGQAYRSGPISDAETLALGRQHHIEARVGESMDQYRARLSREVETRRQKEVH